jgi:hypothetical protein
MAIKTLWPVEHVCGDDEVHDRVSARRSEQATRAGIEARTAQPAGGASVATTKQSTMSLGWPSAALRKPLRSALGRGGRRCVTSTVRTKRFRGEQKSVTGS